MSEQKGTGRTGLYIMVLIILLNSCSTEYGVHEINHKLSQQCVKQAGE